MTPGSLLALGDELETEDCKLARLPLNIHDDTELLADPHRVKCHEGIARQCSQVLPVDRSPPGGEKTAQPYFLCALM